MTGKKTEKTKAKKRVVRNEKKSVRKASVRSPSKTARGKKGAGKPAAPKASSKKPAKTKTPTGSERKKSGSPARGTREKTPQREKKPTTLATRKTPQRSSDEQWRLALRKSLIQRREEIVKEVKSEISKYIKGENRQLVDTALDDGDWSVVDLSEDISFKHMSTHRENLLKIDEALRKLSEGTYGICEDCGEKISEQRLKILPFAIYCTDCQEHREKLEELEKREGLIGS